MPDPDCFLLNARPKSSPLIELTETRDTRDHNHNLALDWEEKILRGLAHTGVLQPRDWALLSRPLYRADSYCIQEGRKQEFLCSRTLVTEPPMHQGSMLGLRVQHREALHEREKSCMHSEAGV